ncbi:hypothetical protein [Pseudomonas taetrolens]|uniref:hypothetical protein n=1 Tax=Pseudomonas taetrolens TaxID=47884 RepID=UPI003F9CD5AA
MREKRRQQNRMSPFNSRTLDNAQIICARAVRANIDAETGMLRALMDTITQQQFNH